MTRQHDPDGRSRRGDWFQRRHNALLNLGISHRGAVRTAMRACYRHRHVAVLGFDVETVPSAAGTVQLDFHFHKLGGTSLLVLGNRRAMQRHFWPELEPPPYLPTTAVLPTPVKGMQTVWPTLDYLAQIKPDERSRPPIGRTRRRPICPRRPEL